MLKSYLLHWKLNGMFDLDFTLNYMKCKIESSKFVELQLFHEVSHNWLEERLKNYMTINIISSIISDTNSKSEIFGIE